MMGNHACDAGSLLDEQLREVHCHIERTKEEHLGLWWLIWPGFQWGIGLETAYYVLAAGLESYN